MATNGDDNEDECDDETIKSESENDFWLVLAIVTKVTIGAAADPQV